MNTLTTRFILERATPVLMVDDGGFVLCWMLEYVGLDAGVCWVDALTVGCFVDYYLDDIKDFWKNCRGRILDIKTKY